jgi:purine nucleoside phosphorylase
VVEAWSSEATEPLVDGGVYWQTVGPRLETPAEIRHISRDADVVGMTAASEAIVAAELGLAYAVVCAVVNYANGVGDVELSVDELREGERATRERLASVLDSVLPNLG